MKKSIIGTLGLVIGISVIIGDGSLLIKENTDDYGQAVAAAVHTSDSGMVFIEEE